MAVMTRAQAKKFIEMDDKMLDVLNYLKDKSVLDAKLHRRFLLAGYNHLVDYLQVQKMLNAKEAKEAMKDGFNSLLISLSK
jgi:hypothetical protein